MSLTKIVQNFKTNIIGFLNELIEQFDTETDLVLARLYLENVIQPEDIITSFVKDVLPYKDSIKNRDENIFLNGNVSFLNGVDNSKVNHFKLLWKSSALDENDRQIIWTWFDTFIYLAEQYQKVKLNNIK